MATISATGPLPLLPLLPLRGVSILPGLTAPVDLSRQSPAMQAVRRAGDRRSQPAKGSPGAILGEPTRGRLVVAILRENTASPAKMSSASCGKKEYRPRKLAVRQWTRSREL